MTNILHRKGVADELLAKKEIDRKNKDQKQARSTQRRSRSVSSYSSDSVSTISTTRSVSQSPPPKTLEVDGKSSHHGQKLGKRDRRSISSDSGSQSAYELQRSDDRNTRRRMSSFSPVRRGRRRSRSRPGRRDILPENNSRAMLELSGNRSRSRGRGTHAEPLRKQPLRRSRSHSSGRMDISDERNPSKNDDARAGRPLHRRSMSASRSRSRSTRGSKRGRALRSRSPFYADRSPSPFSRRALMQSPSSFSRGAARRSPSPYRVQNGRGRGGNHSGDSRRFNNENPEPHSRNGAPFPAPQKERSLSPYSKRVALTRKIHQGH